MAASHSMRATGNTGRSAPPTQKPKRIQVKNACVNCQKACKKCDEARPCMRCMKFGLSSTCRDSERKERTKAGVKRGSYKRKNSEAPDQHGDFTHPTHGHHIEFQANPAFDTKDYKSAADLPTLAAIRSSIAAMYTPPAHLAMAAEFDQRAMPYVPHQYHHLYIAPAPSERDTDSRASTPRTGDDENERANWSKLQVLSTLCSAVLDKDVPVKGESAGSTTKSPQKDMKDSRDTSQQSSPRSADANSSGSRSEPASASASPAPFSPALHHPMPFQNRLHPYTAAGGYLIGGPGPISLHHPPPHHLPHYPARLSHLPMAMEPVPDDPMMLKSMNLNVNLNMNMSISQHFMRFRPWETPGGYGPGPSVEAPEGYDEATALMNTYTEVGEDQSEGATGGANHSGNFLPDTSSREAFERELERRLSSLNAGRSMVGAPNIGPSSVARREDWKVGFDFS
ncbi:hypothetical protein HDU85_002011 [Gaertneriomyces sp. JEL0708]|nr:hypothetical protein HDU85_002011 [Gaertneriomyces sp. JEL0708]